MRHFEIISFAIDFAKITEKLLRNFEKILNFSERNLEKLKGSFEIKFSNFSKELLGNFEIIAEKYFARKICRNFGGQKNFGIDFIKFRRNFREMLT